MSVYASYVEEEDRLDLSFHGNLDFGVSHSIFDIVRSVSSSLQSCIIDLSEVRHVFDSGMALLRTLCCRLRDLEVTIVILGNRSNVAERIAAMP